RTLRQVPSRMLQGRALKSGDVLLEKSGGGEKSPVGFAVTFDSKSRSVCSNFIAALRPTSEADPRFAGLLMAAHYRSSKNVPFIKQTTGIQNLDGESYLAQHVAIPSKTEQSRLARELDESLNSVQGIRATLDRQQDLLFERRQ